MATDVADLAVGSTAAAVAAGELSAEERTRAALSRIEATDDEIGAFLEVWPERALAAARAVDGRNDRASLPLAGVPVALKDNLCVRGCVTRAGSKILEGWESPYDASVVRRLEEAGAVILGHTNMDEFAMGSSTENSALGRTRNPHDADRVPGGSSGGSAAAVAAGMVPAALGSDTGGSVRQPAALCGVAGLKPTYGRVSRYGLVAFASSLDQIGPLARDSADCGRLLAVIAGHDPCDSTCLHAPTDDYVAPRADAGDLRVGIPAAWQEEEGLDDAVRDRFEATVAALRDAGATVERITLDHARYAVATYYVIATAEASANLARYDGVRYGHRTADAASIEELMQRSRSEGFGAEVKRRILLGTYVLSAGYHDAYYLRAQQVRTLIRRDFEAAFESVDVILGPTTPGTAFAFGARTEDPLAMYLSDVFTVPANLAGLPAISLPAGTDADGLPVGMQLCAPPLDESRLLAIARLLESLDI